MDDVLLRGLIYDRVDLKPDPIMKQGTVPCFFRKRGQLDAGKLGI